MKEAQMKRIARLSALACAGVVLFGCTLKHPCDEGFTYDNGSCVPPPPPPPEETEGMGGIGGESSEPPATDEPNFGAPCTKDGNECTGGAWCETFQTNSCIALCGPGDAFEGNCPEDTICQEVAIFSVCAPEGAI